MSLPGVAEKIAYKFYNEAAVPIYSFGEKFKKYNQEIRRSVISLEEVFFDHFMF